MPINWEALSNQPVFFRRNRVTRVYDGGKLFADFFGDEPADGKQPEEWIASTVQALNRDSADPREGLSLIENTDVTFLELLRHCPVQMLGHTGGFDLLVKALDSAIRLPVQAHPNPAFSREHFHSPFGKTEMWLVLQTRPDACIYFGFRQQLTKVEFARAVAHSEEDRDALEPLLNRTPVHPGEVYLIPARCVHAIGAGCLMLEVQEPTDFTIQPEYWCGDYHLSEQEMYLGLDADTALDCFDYSVYGPQAAQLARRQPRVLSDAEGCLTESLIDERDTRCFSVLRYTLTHGQHMLALAPAIYIVTEGEGELCWEGGARPLRRGTYFFLPHSQTGRAFVRPQGRLYMACCLPPKVESTRD